MGEICPDILPSWSCRTSPRDAGSGASRRLTLYRDMDAGWAPSRRGDGQRRFMACGIHHAETRSRQQPHPSGQFTPCPGAASVRPKCREPSRNGATADHHAGAAERVWPTSRPLSLTWGCMTIRSWRALPPRHGRRSTRVHCSYQRCLAGRPVVGRQVRLDLRAAGTSSRVRQRQLWASDVRRADSGSDALTRTPHECPRRPTH